MTLEYVAGLEDGADKTAKPLRRRAVRPGIAALLSSQGTAEVITGQAPHAAA